MKNIIKRTTALLGAMLWLAFCVFAEADLPTPTDKFFVNDYANVLSNETEQHIYETAQAYYRDNGTQVAVLTVPNMGGSDIEDYSLKVARKWGLGDKKADNGILILLAVEERKVRIEVGYGLEGVINDGKAGSMIRKVKSSLSSNDFDTGIRDLYDLVIGQLEDPTSTDYDDGEDDLSIFEYIVLGIILLVIIVCSFSGNGPRGRGRYVSGYYGGFSSGGGGGFSGGGGGFGGGGASGSF